MGELGHGVLICSLHLVRAVRAILRDQQPRTLGIKAGAKIHMVSFPSATSLVHSLPQSWPTETEHLGFGPKCCSLVVRRQQAICNFHKQCAADAMQVKAPAPPPVAA